MLIVIRHALPVISPAVPPHQWSLSEQGRTGAASLAILLPIDALLVSSAEPKARQTLEPAGPVITDARFNEVWRHGEQFDGDFRALREAYVGGTDHAEWEPRAGVVARFDAGIRQWSEVAAARPLAVASHGMAMTLWLTAVIGLKDPAGFWANLRLPDPYAVDLAGCTIRRLVD